MVEIRFFHIKIVHLRAKQPRRADHDQHLGWIEVTQGGRSAYAPPVACCAQSANHRADFQANGNSCGLGGKTQLVSSENLSHTL